MQVLKKLSLIIFCLATFSCRYSPVMLRGGVDDGSSFFEEITLDSRTVFRVGMLLPLTGVAAKQGQGMKNAAMLALDDVKNPNLILQFYDTKSTPAGARIAIENALSQRADLILGPLMSTSLQAIEEEARDERVPVIAFSTSEELLKPGVYTMGLLIDEQVNRVMTYAAQKGKQNFGLLLPDNSTGISVAKAAVRAAQENGVRISRVAFYPPNTTDFSKILREMTGYNSNAKRPAYTFDAVLIPESGARLKSAIAMFGYYDIYSPRTVFLGTSLWEGTSLSGEMGAIGAWYPSLSRVYSSYFATKYNSTFGERPSPLFSLAYDAVALSNALAMKQSINIYSGITNSDGYVGINGVFRIYENGTNEHSLDVYEVRKGGDVVVEAAPKRLVENRMREVGQYPSVGYDYTPPVFIGKDAYTAQALIYGRVLTSGHTESVDYLH